MGGVVPGDVGETQASSASPGSAIDRIVLEHHKRVEQLAQPSQALDLGQTKMLVRHQPRLAVLQLRKANRKRLVGRQASPAAAAC